MAKRDRKRRDRSKTGGRLSSMRSGFKGFVKGGGGKKRESTLSKVITYLLLAAAVGLLVYRFSR